MEHDWKEHEKFHKLAEEDVLRLVQTAFRLDKRLRILEERIDRLTARTDSLAHCGCG